MSKKDLPLRPCNTCGRLRRGGICPDHPPTSHQYRPHRNSIQTGAYDRQYQALRPHILDRDEHTCVYCDNTATTTDHIWPHSRGGTTTPENLAAACSPCNTSKGDLTPEEWVATGRAPALARARIPGNPRFTRKAPQ